MSDEFTLEKLKISERISVLSERVASMETKISIYTLQTNQMLTEHNKMLHGDGNGKVGLNGRVDRIEQREKIRDKTYWTIVTANITIAIKFIWDFFSKQRW